ncbi:MAG: type II secretion system protein [Cyanobacteria bacterium SIG32]|nr:type II secretion system protein [Cyanobacteria bacterium SIG32]
MKNTVKNLITWSPSHLITSPKSAFTLAEVLITLAIIGVVAAMTIPTLITNFEKKAKATKLKKSYAEFINLLQLSKIDNGDITTWIFPNNYELDEIKRFADTYIVPYYRGASACDGLCSKDYEWHYLNSSSNADWVAVYQVQLLNGSYLMFKTGQKMGVAGTSGNINVLLDTNGKTSPNIVGKDIFELGVLNVASGHYLMGHHLSDRDLILDESSTNNCNENVGNGTRCTQLLKLDGWEFKEDYPY